MAGKIIVEGDSQADRDERRPPLSPEDLHTIQTRANVLLVCYLEGKAAMASTPYLPERENLLRKWLGMSEFELLSNQRQREILDYFDWLYGSMLDRARLQRKFAENPNASKANVLQAIHNQSGGEITISHGEAEVTFGLTSLCLTLAGERFNQVHNWPRPETHVFDWSYGFTKGKFKYGLGPLVFLQQGYNDDPTVDHEDAHVRQANSGQDSLLNTIVKRNIASPIESQRLLEIVQDTTHARESDWQIVLSQVEDSANVCEFYLAIELPAYLWSGDLPGTKLLAAATGTTRAISNFAKAVALSTSVNWDDDQRLKRLFDVQKSWISILDRITHLEALVNVASAKETIEIPTRYWIASRVDALPAHLPIDIGMTKTILLGELESEPDIPPSRWEYFLADALVSWASRKIQPDIYDRSDGKETQVLYPQNVGQFINLLAATVSDEPRLRQVTGMAQIADSQLQQLRVSIYSLGRLFFPKGTRGRQEKKFRQALNLPDDEKAVEEILSLE